MGALSHEELPRLEKAVEEHLKSHGKHPVLKLYKSTNRHVLLYSYDTDANAIRLEWLLVHVDKSDGHYIMEFEPVSMIHSMFLGADVSLDGSVYRMNLKAPIGADFDLQVSVDEDGQGMILTETSRGLAMLTSLYVDLADKKAVQVTAEGLLMDSGARVEELRVVDLSSFPIE